MANFKLKQSYYKKATPEKFRKLGDALLGVSTTITGYAIAEEYKWLALTSLILGVIGKFLTNFFAEDDTQNPTV